MKRLSRKEVASDVMLRIIDMIEQKGCDPWPDRLWPDAYEVCEIIVDMIKGCDPHLLSIEAIEERLTRRDGLGLCEVFDLDKPIVRAYQSLSEAYVELFDNYEQLKKDLEKLKGGGPESGLIGGANHG